MAATINDKDKILGASAVRLLPTAGSGILFSNPAPVFKVTTGTVVPLSYAIEARLTGQLQGTVTWSVLTGTINSTAGQSGNTWTIAYSNLLTDSAVVQASLTFLGSTYTNTFTISKIADARSVDLTMTSQAFVYDVNGQVPVPSTSVVTATPQNNLGTAFYEFVVGTTTVQNTTSNTYTYTPPAAFSSMPQQITVRLRENSNTSTVLATDVISMTANKTVVNGTDAVYIDLVSESDVTAAASDGTAYTLPTGNSIRLYRGGTQLASAVVYGPATTTKNGLTATVDTTTGAITFTGASWASDTESFEFTATFNSLVYTATYTLAKSKTGSSAVFIDLLQEADIVPSDNAGGGYTLPTGNSIRLYRGGAQLTTGVVYGPATTTVNGLTLTVNTTTGALTISGASWTTDREVFTVTATFDSVVYSTQYSITKGKAGGDALFIDLVSESDVTTAASDGTGYTLPTGNSIRLYRGASQLGSGVVYGPAPVNKSGLTATVNTTTGAITFSGASWTSDTESFVFTATFNSLVYSTIYTLAKSKTGSSAVFIDLLQEADIIPSGSNGTGYTLPTGNSIRLYRGGAQLTTGVVYGPATTTRNGLTLTVNTTTGALTLSGASWTTDRELFTVTATFDSVVYSTQYSITKAKQGIQGNSITGDTGPRNAQVYYYNPSPSSTAPTIPTAAQLTYNFSTGAAGSTNANWSASFNPNSVTATSANNRYWSVRVTFQENTFEGTYTTTVSAAFTWQNLNGLVTFTNLANGQGSGGTSATFIDGASIVTSSLTADKISSGTATVGSIGQFGLGGTDKINGFTGVGRFKRTNLVGGETNGFTTITFNEVATDAAGSAAAVHIGPGWGMIAYNATNTNYNSFATTGALCSKAEGLLAKTNRSIGTVNNLSLIPRTILTGGTTEAGAYAAFYGQTASNRISEVFLASGPAITGTPHAGYFLLFDNNGGGTPKQVFLAQGIYSINSPVGGGGAFVGDGYAPFTGVHDGIISTNNLPEIGDILVDYKVLKQIDISNSIVEYKISSTAVQRGVIGVCAVIHDTPPSDWSTEPIIVPAQRDLTREIEPNAQELPDTILEPSGGYKVPNGYKVIFVNALGEGGLNVCGENGNITAGDLIVTSSIPGKGMRQDDDIVRSYTVAKARESVVFDSPGQIKRIACIYLCG